MEWPCKIPVCVLYDYGSTKKSLLSCLGHVVPFKNFHLRKGNIVNDRSLYWKILTAVRREGSNVLGMHTTMFLLIIHTNDLNLLDIHSKLFKWKGNKPWVLLYFRIGPRVTHPVQPSSCCLQNTGELWNHMTLSPLKKEFVYNLLPMSFPTEAAGFLRFGDIISRTVKLLSKFSGPLGDLAFQHSLCYDKPSPQSAEQSDSFKHWRFCNLK